MRHGISDAIGVDLQGYAIGSAALVSLALFGAYVTRAEITSKDSSILSPEVCSCGACACVLDAFCGDVVDGLVNVKVCG